MTEHLPKFRAACLTAAIYLLATLAVPAHGLAAQQTGAFPDADLFRQWGLGGISRAFALGFSIAAPFVIAGLIYNVALGAINRAMPQLMVSMIGAPAQTLGGLALLMIALPTGLLVWHDAFDAFLANPFEVLR